VSDEQPDLSEEIVAKLRETASGRSKHDDIRPKV
jgi:hypothetical protein